MPWLAYSRFATILQHQASKNREWRSRPFVFSYLPRMHWSLWKHPLTVQKHVRVSLCWVLKHSWHEDAGSSANIKSIFWFHTSHWLPVSQPASHQFLTQNVQVGFQCTNVGCWRPGWRMLGKVTADGPQNQITNFLSAFLEHSELNSCDALKKDGWCFHSRMHDMVDSKS